MEAKKSYVVQDKGGPRPDIAGTRRKVGETILLTESEARFEVSRGIVISQEDLDKQKADAQAEKAKARSSKED